MRLLVAGVFAVAAVGIGIAGCNRNRTQPQTQPAPPPAASIAQPAPAPILPPPIPPAAELAVNTVDSVMLSRPQDTPTAIVVHVTGTTISPGWTEPKLVEETDNVTDSDTKTYKFLATSPETPDENRTSEPIEAEIRIDSLPPAVKTIRILSATNEISAPVAQ